MGRSKVFVLWRAQRQGLSRTPDSLTDAADLNYGWYIQGEFTKNGSVTTRVDPVIRGQIKDPHLANPTPRLAPLVSRSMRVETTCPKGFSMASNSCSSMVSGRLDMYRLVGSCSCCCRERKRKKNGELFAIFQVKKSLINSTTMNLTHTEPGTFV